MIKCIALGFLYANLNGCNLFQHQGGSPSWFYVAVLFVCL